MKKILFASLLLAAASIMALSCSPGVDFSGKYFIAGSGQEDWCGHSLELKKISSASYTLEWELNNGERYSMELSGTITKNSIDFKRESYGYIFLFSDDKMGLEVQLKVPDKTRVCRYRKSQ